jgi:hypothetical protein
VLDYYAFLDDLDDQDHLFLDLAKALLRKPHPKASVEIVRDVKYPLAWLMEGLPISEQAAVKTVEDIQVHLPDAGQ